MKESIVILIVVAVIAAFVLYYLSKDNPEKRKGMQIGLLIGAAGSYAYTQLK